MIIRDLRAEEFEYLSHIFRRDFDSDLPSAENSTIIAAFDKGKLVGFIHCETLVMVGQIWAIDSDSTEIVAPLIRTVRERFDGKATVGTLASEPRFEALFRSMGMEHIEGTFFRKNY